MYCPQCGNESHGTQYCRVCGANLKALGNSELAQTTSGSKHRNRNQPWRNFWKKKTPAERREDHISKGVVSFFSGVGLSVFLYFLSAALVLKLPPDVIAQIPFEIGPVVRIIWLLGLLPTTAGVGHILAGLLIRPEQQPARQLHPVTSPQLPRDLTITDHTTNLLS